MLKLLLTGGTGFLGSALVKTFLASNYDITLVSHYSAKAHQQFGQQVKVLAQVNELQADDSFDVIINLAGAPIFGALWTAKRKAVMRDSRIKLTTDLVAKIATFNSKPKLLISGSAIGFYGEQGTNIVTEESTIEPDFSQTLCADWEDAALKAEQYGVRVCVIRTGLVLGKEGGFLKPMLLPFKLGLGGQLGKGTQWMSWIHLNDWVAIVKQMMADEQMHGAYNATAPNPVTNSEFTQQLAKSLHRPAFLPVPRVFLKWLLGEMADLLLCSQHVLPMRLQTLNFEFEYPDLSLALKQVVQVSDV